MIWIWIGFVAFILAMLALDLGVFNRHEHEISSREALRWSGFCILLALAFNVLVYFLYEHGWVPPAGIGAGFAANGADAAKMFFLGYIVEQSLSLDNIFVIALIFEYFRVPRRNQHRVLFWGILGALVFRGLMIWAGAILIERFHWINYFFGALLIYTAIKMLLADAENIDPEKNVFSRLARKIYPVTVEFDGRNFFTLVNGRRAMTPLFLALLVVETTDVLFAIDSVPAIFGLTKEPFLVFTSNVFAILNLRSMYFALAAVIDKFKYLKASLVFLLVYIGLKMIISLHVPLPDWISLVAISTILGVGIVASLLARPRRPKTLAPLPIEEEVEDVANQPGQTLHLRDDDQPVAPE